MIPFFATHPTAANLLMFAFLTLGMLSLPTLRRETFPDFRTREVEIRVLYPGATPEEVEEAICQRIEDAIDNVRFVEETRCDARQNMGVVTVEMVENGDWSAFKDEIEIQPDTQFYLTYAVLDQHELKIGKNIDELVALFNVYFDTATTRQNFTYVDDPQNISADLLAGSYDYALITMDDWIAMQEPKDQLASVKSSYEITFEPGGDFVLLVLD